MKFGHVAWTIATLIISAVLTNLWNSSQVKQANEEQLAEVQRVIAIGDDIHQAKEALMAAGFKIHYGPDYPPDSKSKLVMIIDYRARPSEPVRPSKDGKPMFGMVEADPNGKITSIQ